MSLLEARGVGRTFPAPAGGDTPAVVALEGVDLDVGAGEMVVVTGASGSGKSTLLSVLGGLDPPTAGEVRLDGRSLYARSARALALVRAREVGFVFQDFALIEHLTALENVAIPQLFAGEDAGEGKSEDRPRELLARFGLEARLRHKPTALSRGEMQRVALARALVNRPRVVIADEPTANLDRANATTFLEELSRLTATEGVAVVLAAHRDDVLEAQHRIVVLEAGRRVDEGS